MLKIKQKRTILGEYKYINIYGFIPHQTYSYTMIR